MSVHPVRIRADLGEQSEGGRGLEDQHVAAIDGAAAPCPGLSQQFGIQRPIHDVRNPQVTPEQRRRHRDAELGCHPDRRRVDEPVGPCQKVLELADGARNHGPVVSAHCCSEACRAFGVDVNDVERPRAETEQRVRDGRAGAAGAHQHNPVERRRGQTAANSLGKPTPIGVMTNATTISEYDGVDGLQCPRLR